MKRVEIEINGRIEKMAIQRTNGGLWVHWNGEAHFFPIEVKRTGKKREEGSAKKIVAPMPGKITKVLVKVGDEVQPKQSVILMEAMKMEYNLKSSGECIVKSVNCSAGDQVDQDQILVEFQ